jgi:anthocyanidin reductase
VLSEKEACRFAQEHGISLVTVCPVLTVGAAPASKIHTSVPASLSLLSGCFQNSRAPSLLQVELCTALHVMVPPKLAGDEAAFGVLKGIEMATGCVSLVHVADLCRAEMFVAEEDAAAGRYVCCSVNTTIVELARFLADKYPQYTVKTDML